MKHNFCAAILTHRRPDNVKTIRTLRRCGYTGPIVLVLDDTDDTIDEYRENYPEAEIVIFNKQEVADTFDTGDNFNDLRAVVYARNACPQLLLDLGYRYFVQLDDDYSAFQYRLDERLDPNFGGERTCLNIENLDDVFDAMVDFVASTPFKTLTMSQGGDLMGGGEPRLSRKAMNSFICDAEDPVTFIGRINEDVNTYTRFGLVGELYGTTRQLALNQAPTQAQTGGLTDIYKAFGTYVKSFYTVMWAPGCTKVSVLEGNIGTGRPRVHHRINYHKAFPKIVRETHRKASQGPKE